VPQLATFCYELGILQETPRSGFAFLGSGSQTVAEHSHRALGIAFLLARLSEQPVDELRLLHMVLFHDLPEARTGDLNYVHQKYVHVNWERVLGDEASDQPYGPEIAGLVSEFEARETPEARLAADADQLELLCSLREELDRGNPLAADWLPPVVARIATPAGRQLAEEILTTRSDAWWFRDKNERYWVDRSDADG